MSHLSTIIHRVNRRLNDVYKGNVKRAAKDGLWRQSIRNLKEYMDSWNDTTIQNQITEKEIDEAVELYFKYKKYDYI